MTTASRRPPVASSRAAIIAAFEGKVRRQVLNDALDKLGYDPLPDQELVVRFRLVQHVDYDPMRAEGYDSTTDGDIAEFVAGSDEYSVHEWLRDNTSITGASWEDVK